MWHWLANCLGVGFIMLGYWNNYFLSLVIQARDSKIGHPLSQKPIKYERYEHLFYAAGVAQPRPGLKLIAYHLNSMCHVQSMTVEKCQNAQNAAISHQSKATIYHTSMWWWNVCLFIMSAERGHFKSVKCCHVWKWRQLRSWWMHVTFHFLKRSDWSRESVCMCVC